MKLHQLIDGVCLNGERIEIESLAFDSSQCKRGSLFFCLKGRSADGHDYVAEAKKNGAVCAVVERFTQDDLPQILVPSARIALALAARRFYGEADTRLTMIAVTGTNGKTSTAYLIKAILEEAGKKVGMIGTNGVFIGSKRFESGLTTPDPIEYHQALASMEDSGVQVVVSEVSAHALALCKVEGIRYDVACFTNLTRDHLDFFEDMKTYESAKRRLFSSQSAAFAVVNVDDEAGRRILNGFDGGVLSYGTQNPADVFAIEEEFGEDGVKFVMNLADEIIPIKSSLCGHFNVYNIMCAAAVAYRLGVKNEQIAEGIRKISRVDGRFNVISTKNNSIIIDFAHTDDGLKNALTAIREFAKGEVITVFGCGGNRDKSKRPLMGEIASTLSDFCVLTSDNPRDEEPLAIIDDIKKGLVSDRYAVVPKRKDAIVYAVKRAKPDDIVFIAGKGAEQYQEINGVRYDYNDEKFVMRLIEENEIE